MAAPITPGQRPWGWWRYVAKRDQHVVPLPPSPCEDGWAEMDEDEEAEALDRYECEPIEWLAAHGHLTDEEVAVIAERASEARQRIGTDEEHIGTGGVDRADRRAVALYEAVQTAMSE